MKYFLLYSRYIGGAGALCNNTVPTLYNPTHCSSLAFFFFLYHRNNFTPSCADTKWWRKKKRNTNWKVQIKLIAIIWLSISLRSTIESYGCVVICCHLILFRNSDVIFISRCWTHFHRFINSRSLVQIFPGRRGSIVDLTLIHALYPQFDILIELLFFSSIEKKRARKCERLHVFRYTVQ